MRKYFNIILFLSFTTLTACSTVLENVPGVYSLDIQQGNVVTQDMIDQLRPKMTKRQVLYIMGSSMLKDVFHAKRWDYLYSEQLDGEPRLQKRLSLFFDGDELVSVQGDFRPSSKPVPRINQDSMVEVPARVLEKTLWEKITGLFSDDTVVPTEPDTEKEQDTPENTDS